MKLWFADENLIIESVSKQKTAFEISFGNWRDVTRDSMLIDMGNQRQIVRADSVNMSNKGIVWNHRNANYPSSLVSELKKQSISPESINNPTKNNVFGGVIVCNRALTPLAKTPVNWQCWKGAAWSMTTAAEKSHTIVVALHAGKKQQPEKWLSAAKELLKPSTLQSVAVKEAKPWNEFWSRSYIHINTARSNTDSAWIVGRNYQLFRYMLACNQNGQLPLLFNGGIFTVDNFNKVTGNNGDTNRKRIDPSSPDLRHWLVCGFMAQNQRWLGWPIILAGDTDLLEPSNAFYRMHATSAASRAKGLGAQGVVYPEAIQAWGLTWNPTPTGQCKLMLLL